MPLSRERKEEYFEKMKELLGSYTKAFVVDVDNVGSKQLQNTRIGLRGKAEILMGKNTMMRKVFREFAEENPDAPISQMGVLCRGNVGFIFTNGDLGDIRTAIDDNVRPAPARVGGIAPSDVIVPAGPTGCDPGQTAFFQTLQIATKITKGQIEMTNNTHLITAGEKVGASQAALLQKMEIYPFAYGLVCIKVFDDGSIFDPEVLEITPQQVISSFKNGVKNVAAVSIVLEMPTMASVSYSILLAYANLLAVAAETDFSFKQAEAVRKHLGK